MLKNYFPLHPAQQDVYMDQLLNTASPEYNIGGYIVLKGDLDRKKFHEAVNSAPAIFDSLKMRFDLRAQDLLCHYDDDYNKTQLSELDFSDRDNDVEAAKEWMRKRFNTPFVLNKENLPFEQYLVKINDKEHWYFGKYHHLILDGYGFIIYVQYVAEKYRALLNGEEQVFSYPSYREAAISANEYLQSTEYQQDGSYWKDKIPVRPEKLLQKRHTTDNNQGNAGATYSFTLNEQQRTRLEAIQVAGNAGLQQLTIAALLIYFGKTTANSEFIFGTPIHKRGSRQLRNTVGMFSGIIPFKGNYNMEQPLAELLKEISGSQRADYRHQNYLIGDLSRDLKINTSEGYLCEVLVNYEPLGFELSFGEAIEANIVRLANEDERNPLQLNWRDYGKQQALELQIQFGFAYFTQEEIELLAKRVLFIIEQFPNALDKSIDSTNILPFEEATLLQKFNDTKADYPKDKSLVTLFEEQVKDTPEARAIIFEDKQLTYNELNEKANQLAHYLQKQGVKAETLVPICVERSLEMMIGILGILKAGGAYVPIDPEYPSDRISYMLEDTGASIILSSKASREKLNGTAQIIELDEDWKQIEKEQRSNLKTSIHPNQLAYVIYTSGSTGKPKGAMNEHGGVVNRLLWAQKYFKLTSDDTVLQKTTFCFDVSVWELLWPLLAGSRLVFAKPGGQADSSYLKSIIDSQKVTMVHFVPSMLSVFLSDLETGDCKGLKNVLCSGEALSPAQVKLFEEKLPEVKLHNLYGPTEAAIDVSYWSLDKDTTIDIVPIGKPIDNVQLYILSGEQNQLSPIGVAGELYIGGVQVGRGYLNRPELTAEKFITNPFSQEKGARLYKTGDLARWLPDGNIEYLGRIDDQVKIRGFRIELGEIESVLEQSDLVKQAIVLAKEDKQGTKRLVGYIVPQDTFDKQAIQAYLHTKLPDYMVPALWVELSSIPLTPNGKTDKKALPDPEITDITTTYTAPRNETEQALAAIWQQVLGADHVGVHDNFFELGGHSLSGMRVVSSIRKELNIELNIRELFAHADISSLGAYLDKQTKGTLLPAIVAGDRPEYIPLSFSQERLWFVDSLTGSIQYHLPAVIRLKGELDREALKRTLKHIINRHEALRTVIREHEGRGYQHIMPADGWFLNVNKRPAADENLSEYISALIDKPFNLSADNMLRADLLELGSEDHILVVTMHHIASDGWSISILVKEVIALYEGYAENIEIDLPALPVQYADYSMWQHKYLQGEILENKLDYWKTKLDGIAPLQLPADINRPLVQSSRGATGSFKIDTGLSGRLSDLSQQQGVTLFMTLLSAFNVLLYRYSGQDDICVGTPIAGRDQQELEDLIGFFINTLALRSQVRGNMPFIELLGEVKVTTLEAYAHQEVPFEKVVDTVVKERDMSRNPLFDVMFVLQNTPEVPELKLGNLSLSTESREHTTTQFDITFLLNETSSGIEGTIEYNTDLYKAETVERMMGHYTTLLQSIVASPEEQAGRLNMLGAKEEENLLVNFNSTDADYGEFESIISLFEAQAVRGPESVAIVFEKEQITYKELNERSNQLAYYLQKQGVKPQTLVPVCMERGVDMIIGLLGILKAGGAYVPVDPEYPQERISYMLIDSGADLVLSSKASSGKLSGTNAKVISIDLDREIIQKEKITNPKTVILPKQLAYVIYTSGSMGKPKGVMVEHNSVANYCLTFKQYFSISDQDKILQQSSISFDTMVEELYPALISGARVIIAKEGGKDIDAIKNYIESDQLTILSTTPTVIDWLNKELTATKGLRYIISGGEVLPPHFIDKIYQQVQVVNTYGPSEGTVCATYHKIDDIAYASLIGKPIPNTRIHILNNDNALSPMGVIGEICIGGIQVARSYLNRPDLTAEKFIADPFSKEKGARLYKTGDLGKWLPDGNIEYLGRIDDQVKIRGYRIELGEIEAVLNESDWVKQAVVLAKGDSGGKRLVAYVVPKAEFDKQAIQAYLKAELPDYMVPSVWIELENIPLTPSGKIDRKALPDPELADIKTEFVAPRNETEKALADIWQRLLSLKQVGIYDNFFELGGHSLLAMRVVSAIRSELNVELNIRDLFIHPDIAGLGAFLIKQAEGMMLPAITSGNRPEFIPLSFSQERLWFTDKLEGSVQYHLPAVLRLKGALNFELLEKTLRAVIGRHEILRTVINEHNGQGYQSIMPSDSWSLGITEGPGKQAGLSSLVAGLVIKPFNLSADFMLRADLIRLNDNDHVLVATMHHIASDGWSTSILVKEVIALYEEYAGGIKANLADLPIQYADYSIWQRQYMQEGFLEERLGYWKEKLDDVATLELPADYSRQAIQLLRGATRYLEIEPELSAKVQAFSHGRGVTPYMTLLSAFNVLLYRYSGQEDICVGTTVAGRNRQELEGLIGFFVNTLALRSHVKGDMPFIDLLDEVKRTTLAAYAHQDIPFEKVVDAVVRGRDMSRHPLFQVLFSLQNTPEVPELRLGELQLSSEGYEHSTTRFDIAFMLRETDTGIQGTIEYNTDLFKGETIERMISHYVNLLGSIIAMPEKPVGQLEILSAEEKTALKTFGESEVNYPKEATIAGLFESQAQQHPERAAVAFAGESISYKTLNERGNQLANELISKGVKENTLVPLYTARGIDMLTGILGILKAGGGYVPIDTEFPEDRISYMLEDTGAAIAVSSGEYTQRLQQLSGPYVEVIALDDLNKAAATTNPKRSLKPEHLAYVIYTSGSTGKPKGVEVSHQNLADYVYGLEARTQISKCKSYALVSTIATDLGNTVLYSSLLFGGTLHVFTRETVSHIEELHAYFEEHQIDCLKIVPSHWKALSPEDGPPLLPKRMLIFGGEAFPMESAARIRNYSEDCKIYNHYGPTETTIGKLVYEVKAGHEGNTIPIGKPFSNTKTYVLSKDLSQCPVGVPGQLYIAGTGVAKGYLNRPELTAEKFIQDPNGKAGERMYATGDRVQYQKDGNILFIGRVDDQVKIRGYRVEPGEVGRILEESELVSQAIVLAKDDKQGNKQLIGYIIPNGDYDKTGIQEYLRQQLPDYMIPAHLMPLESFPLTQNGKIDRKALPDPENTQATGGYTAPGNETEQRLAEIWQDILEVDQVGINDDFFVIGGHSLLAVRLVSAIRKTFGIELPIADVFDYPTVALLATRLTEEASRDILPSIITAGPRPERIPLSFAQERLWFIDKLEGSVQYHVPAVFHLDGELNRSALEKTLKYIIDRHEVLRTVILEDTGGHGYQEIMPGSRWSLIFEDHVGYKESIVSLERHIKQLIETPFELSKDYKLRANLIKTAKEDHVLVVTMHHIASDGWSTSILVKEVIELYAAFDKGSTTNLPELGLQYADYAIWQRSWLHGPILDEKLAYWKEKLADVSPLSLPTDYSRPSEFSTRGANINVSIDKKHLTKLQDLSRQHGATLYMTLLSAFKVLLYRYSNQEDICVGTPIAGRQQHEVEGLIGFFVNTLALRSQVNGSMRFTDLLSQVRTTTLEAYGHQEVPFEKVVDAVVKERDMSRSPLFQVMFDLSNMPQVPELRFGGVKLSLESVTNSTTKFDLGLSLKETENGLQGSIEYNTDLYKEETIRLMLNHFEQLIGSILADPGQSIGSLKMLGRSEEATLLQAFNDTAADYPKDKSVVALFEEQVAKSPDAIAIIYKDQELTYKELNGRSNRLAHYLQNKGVKTDTPIPICVERSLEMVIGILGILKAGGAYVPVDPEYPQDRISYMLDDTSASIILSSKASRNKLKDTSALVIVLDGEWDQIEKEKNSNPEAVILPGQMAYVIYTSGSTGKPKGVMIEHQSFINYLTNNKTTYVNNDGGMNAGSFIHLSYTFDASITALFMPLLSGKYLVIGSNDPVDVLTDGNLEKYAPYDFIKITPSHLGLLPTKFKTSDNNWLTAKLVIGGEALRLSQFDAIINEGINVEIINEYGPTEATVGCSTYEFYTLGDHEFTQNEVPIGKPIANTQIYILDADQALSPVGVPGELCIGGDGLARGYLNKPELTAEKFITNPFSQEKGARLYKTGDLARWLPDGNIEYLGRIDDQVKIRGFRIEPGEIESVLEQSDLVKQAVVLAKEDKQGTKRLVGYIVPEGTFDKQAIQAYLHTKLPDYMVPAIWVELTSIPLTPNGKADKKALPDPEITDIATEYTAPRNETEQALATIWQELLGVEHIGIYDNFFELGGDSILTIQVVSRMRRAGYTMQPKDIFNHQAIAGLSDMIRLGTAQTATGEQGQLTGTFGPLPIQSWYLEKEPKDISHFNQSVLLQIDKSITAVTLQTALEQLMAQHDALRLVFEKSNNTWQQRYGTAQAKLQLEDLSTINKAELAEQISKRSDHYQRSLSITEGKVISMVLMQTPKVEQTNRLLIVIHHLAVDGVSWRIILEDLEQLIGGQQPSLGTKGSSYRQWYQVLEQYSQSRRLQGQKAYWDQVASSYAALPEDKMFAGEVHVKDMGHCQVKLGAAQTSKLLHEVPRVYHTEINDLLLAALSATLCEWSGKQQVVIGLEGHGRESISDEIDSSRTVGWFTTLYPVALKTAANADILIKGIKEELRRIPDKGLGYGVLKYINKTEELQGKEPWDIIFNYLGQLDTAVGQSNWLAVATESLGSEISGEQLSESKITVNSHIFAGELVLDWSYSTKHYNPETIIKLAADYVARLTLLIDQCLEKGKSGVVYTPSDYGLSDEISYEELDRFLEEPHLDDDIMSF